MNTFTCTLLVHLLVLLPGSVCMLFILKIYIYRKLSFIDRYDFFFIDILFFYIEHPYYTIIQLNYSQQQCCSDVRAQGGG